MEEHEILPGFIRPTFAPMIFRDEAGNVIPYGDRWGDEVPPDDSYSVDPHRERFAPVQEVATALIDFLAQTYLITVDEDLAHGRDLVRPSSDVARAVRLQPSDDGCSPLTLVFSGYPAVHCHAGWSVETIVPSCGCDACDETWEGSADDLETWVDNVVNGHIVEAFEPAVVGGHRITFRDRDGALRSERWNGGIDPELFVTTPLREQDLPLTVSWKPWPLRAGSPAGPGSLTTQSESREQYRSGRIADVVSPHDR